MPNMETEKLNALKDKGNYTLQGLSNATNIPLSTMSRIFKGEGSPSYENVVAIVRAMGGSLDEISGLRTTASTEVVELRQENAALKRQLDYADRALETSDGRLHDKDRATEYLKKGIKYLATALAIMVAVFVGIVIFDILNGGVGYIRYDELSAPRMEVLLSALPDWFGLR